MGWGFSELFWTWNKDSKTCMVKKAKTFKTAVGHAVSGNSGCGRGCIVEDETEYSYHDIPNGRKKTENQQECADFSALTQGQGQGLFWTWKKSNKMCYLKSSGDWKEPVGDAVSGNSKCGNLQGLIASSPSGTA